MISETTKRVCGPVASGYSVLGKIRMMLREEPTLERELIRERLRAIGWIAQNEKGGFRVCRMFHYLRRRGEISTTPTHITVADLLPARPRKRPASRRPEGPQSRRIRLAAKRAKAIEKRACNASLKLNKNSGGRPELR